MLGPQDLILILIIVVIFFGGKRIPEIMSGIGQGIKTFKKAMEEEDKPAPPLPKPEAPSSTQIPTQHGNESANVAKDKIEPQ